MDVFTRIVKDFSKISTLANWPEVQTLFRRTAASKPGHWLLPLRACEAVSGNSKNAVPILTAMACSHIGIVLVDDMLDADPRGEHLHTGEPAAANMASALQAAALAVISRCKLSAEAKLTALEGINEMFLSTTLGQYWDIQPVTDEDGYWRITKTKSSPFFGAALQLGALTGGATMELAAQIKDLGNIYGEMIQIHDDLHDTMEVPANPDWAEGRSPLPILFARLVEHPLRAHFEELRPNAGNSPEVLEEAQGILIRCGAVSYCIHELINRYQRARQILSCLTIVHPQAMTSLFEDAVTPAFKLFQAAGEMPAELSTTEMLAEWE